MFECSYADDTRVIVIQECREPTPSYRCGLSLSDARLFLALDLELRKSIPSPSQTLMSAPSHWTT